MTTAPRPRKEPPAMSRQTRFDGYLLSIYEPALHEAWQRWFTDLGLDLRRIPGAGWVEVNDDTRTVTFPYYLEPDSSQPTPYTITLDRDVPVFPDHGRPLDPALPRRPKARHVAERALRTFRRRRAAS